MVIDNVNIMIRDAHGTKKQHHPFRNVYLFIFLLDVFVTSKLSYNRHRKQFNPNKSSSDL